MRNAKVILFAIAAVSLGGRDLIAEIDDECNPYRCHRRFVERTRMRGVA